MTPLLQLLATATVMISSITEGAAGFSGNFDITELVVYSPFQADPSSTANSSISFTFCDQDTPEYPTHCCLDWKVGLQPPVQATQPGQVTCDNSSVSVWVNSGDWHGVENFTLQFEHSYEDDSLGPSPYNFLSKFGGLNVTYPGTKGYECDLRKAICEYGDGTMEAEVTSAVA